MIDFQQWFREMDAEQREWLRTRYVDMKVELLNDSKLEPAERQFLLTQLCEYAHFLEEMAREEAEK